MSTVVKPLEELFGELVKLAGLGSTTDQWNAYIAGEGATADGAQRTAKFKSIEATHDTQAALKKEIVQRSGGTVEVLENGVHQLVCEANKEGTIPRRVFSAATVATAPDRMRDCVGTHKPVPLPPVVEEAEEVATKGKKASGGGGRNRTRTATGPATAAPTTTEQPSTLVAQAEKLAEWTQKNRVLGGVVGVSGLAAGSVMTMDGFSRMRRGLGYDAADNAALAEPSSGIGTAALGLGEILAGTCLATVGSYATLMALKGKGTLPTL